MVTQQMFDILESRTLFSVAAVVPPLPKGAGPLTTAAYTVAKTAATALKTAERASLIDAHAFARASVLVLRSTDATIVADKAAIRAAKVSITVLQKADFKQLIGDGRALVAAYRSGNSVLFATDLITVKADAAKLKADTSGSPIVTAVAKLAADVNASATVAPLFAKVQADAIAVPADVTTYKADLVTYLTDRKTKPSP